MTKHSIELNCWILESSWLLAYPSGPGGFCLYPRFRISLFVIFSNTLPYSTAITLPGS